MRSRKWLLLSFGILCLPVLALAGVQDTRHDMTKMGLTPGYVTNPRGSCSYCHVPHGAQGARLWAGAYSSTYTATKGLVSNLCYTCHSLTAIVDPTNTSNRMFTGSSVHGHSKAANSSDARYAQGWLVNAAGNTLPYVTSSDNATTPMECTSCHDVHGSTAKYRPFLRAPIVRLDASTPSLCERCHGGRLAQGTMGSNTNGSSKSTHPIFDGTNIYDGRISSPVTWGDNVNRALRSDNGVISGAASGRDFWILGGHIDNNFATTSTNNGVACVSCHAVHGADPTLSVSGGADSWNAVLVGRVDDAGETLCAMCHPTNPGLSTTNSHTTVKGAGPWTSTTSGHTLAIGSMPISASPPSTAYGTSRMQCTSCHDTHYGNNNTPILVDNNATLAGGFSALCEVCHIAPITTSSAGHHPAPGASTQWNTTNGSDNLWNRSLLSLSTGVTVVDCNRCHRVHNSATNQGPLPGNEFLLTGNNWDNTATPNPIPTSKMCVECHTVNPSTYTTARTDGLGSHFVSHVRNYTAPASILPGLQPATSERWGSTAALRNWPTNGTGTIDNAFSKYSGQSFSFTLGANARGGMICESCHSVTTAKFAKNLLGRFDNTAFSATNDNTAGGDGLCRGCHQTPAGTHPTTGVLVTRFNRNLVAPNAPFATTPVDTGYQYAAYSTGTNELTCWGCHNAHDADTGAAGFVLKKGTTGTTSGTFTGTGGGGADVAGFSLNYTPLCAGCHPSYR